MTPIDVFFCHIPNTRPEARFRDHLARGCLERWRQDPLARVVLLQPEGTPPLVADVPTASGGPVERFHLARYRVPQANTSSEWFIVADDDCLPLGRDFIARGLEIARAHPEYGVLAASEVVGVPPCNPHELGVVPSHGVGGICFVSPRCPRFNFDVASPGDADSARFQQVRGAGLQEARLLGVRMNHLGYGFSTVATGHWGSP